MEIETLGLKSVSNGAHFVFIESICKRLDSETELLKNEYFKKAADALKAAFNEENRYFALSKKSASTDEILAADADRDTLYSAYYRSVKSFLRVSSSDLHTAAKTLWQSLVDYGIKPSMQLERETGAIQNLLEDCEQKYSAEVAKLGLQTVLASLKTANAKVSELLYSRTTEQSKQVAGALRKARQQSDEAFKQVRKVANAMATLGSAEAQKPFADFVNQLIKRYEDEVLPKKKKADDGKQPGDKPGDGKKPGDSGKKPDGKKPGGDAAKPGEGGDGKDKPGGKGQGDATITPKK
jgi:possible hemagglutinin protein hagB